ncbi:hypothetical protein OPV22_019352 [Ensete ventricosum]|uniref:Bifunctional inhibitor/plant lipid transfer protein/seed storage helical domain-containing protein n=1 Tax=Ensete ventricosum TaxID=4639 RepID=A0AAV8P993_ENSVE|nr:hypothetical protein OPV22_019352 [Ensete ventricosum]RWW06417.1 hypothetical protein GW17_00030256 [Ensete ventricosum]RWW45479.1 hypothetical protein BHE74_00048675 [Ensete ventricosum]
MESRQAAFALLLLLLVASASGRMVKVTSAGVCNVSTGGLSACRSAVSEWFADETPSPECCAAVAAADFGCFCSYLKSPLLWFLGVSSDRVKQLPAKCNVHRPLPDCVSA